ncbi:MAG TPA: DUF3662 and FHA domain-containing protein [Microbacteriaceae bacterium]|nr:DUF3662 and FHA domain-containing protein [Microbacteriaceae bacterium]
MGVLDNIERGLERIVNGVFAKTFRSGLQPVEITSALKRELDTKASVVSRDRVLVPNLFTVRLAGEDFDRMTSLGTTLIDELSALVTKHAKAQQYQFAGPVAIRLQSDLTLSPGMLQVDSNMEQGDVDWTAVLDLGSSRVELKPGRLIIGRGSDADLTIDDSGASRKHAAVEWDGHRARVRDLGSTNGTQLDGIPVSEAVLEPESVITIGRTRIVFRILASANGRPVQPGGDSNPSTERFDGFWSEQ